MKIHVFGEVLWDVFETDAHIGGASFNFAAHMSKLGAEAKLISAVGKDELGERAVKIAREYGIDTSEIPSLDLPTGYCKVTLIDGTPSYELVENVAYDAIPMPACGLQGEALYFGTLACRDARSFATLKAMLGGDYRQVFFDINIRQNFHTPELIDFSMKNATILKISREEIGILGIKGSCEDIARSIAEKYPNLRLIIVTLDKDGAFALSTEDGKISYAPIPKSKVTSTVGAGDSFSACFLFHLLRGDGVEKSLECASALSDYVVTRLEAVPDYPAELKAKIM